MTTTTTTTVPRLPRHWLGVAALLGAALGYGLAVTPRIHSPAQLLYPVVWTGASLAALWVVRDALGRVRPLAAAVGAGYTLALLWTAGLLAPASGPVGATLHLAMPGWGPAVVYTGPFLTLQAIPFLLVGYLTLGALVALAVGQTLRTAAAGVVGLFACVSCTAPLVAGIAGALGAGSLSASLSHAQYPVATAAFLVSLGALVTVLRRGPSATD
jgi:hypothetical protein